MNDKAIRAAAKEIERHKMEPWTDTKAVEIARDAIAAYEAAMWRPREECPEEWKDGRPVLIEFVHDNAKYSSDPIGEGWIAVHEAHWIDHNGGGWTWNGLCGVARRIRPLPTPPEGE